MTHRTEAEYNRMVRELEAWAEAARLPTTTAAELDSTLTLWMNEAFFEGEPAGAATRLIAALTFWRADLSQGAPELCRSGVAARGWRKLAPGRTRLPLPLAVAFLMSEWCWDHGRRSAAVATLVCFAFMLRPSELLRLRSIDLVPPGNRGPKERRKWSLVLHPTELGVSSKVGEFDETLALDNPDFGFLGAVFKKIRRERKPLEPAFDLDYKSWMESFRLAGVALQLEALGPPVLYQLRHGGASHEALTGFRDGVSLLRRGRWASERSVKRYAKGGRVNQVLSLLTADQLLLAEQAEGRLRGCLSR